MWARVVDQRETPAHTTVGAQGPPGPKGEPGDTGPAGPAGADGTGGGSDPTADETITGARDFRSTAAFVGASLDIAPFDPETGDPTPNAGIRYTVTEAGHGPQYRVGYDMVDGGGGTTTLSVVEIAPTEEVPVISFLAFLPTVDGNGADLLPTTAAEVVDAFNAGPPSGRIVAALMPGHDGTGVIPSAGVDGNTSAFLRGGAITPHVEITAGIITSPVTIHPDEVSETPLTLRPALGSTLGTAVLNIEHRDGTPNDSSGYGVSHLDSDGGGAFCGERFSFSEGGHVRIDGAPGGSPLAVSEDGAVVFGTGGDYAALSAFSHTPTQRALALAAATDQTADMIEVYEPSVDGITFRVTPAGEVHASAGVVLTSPGGTQYRVVVADDGTLSTVAV